MKYKEVSLLSTKEINALGYTPLWICIRSRHDEKRETTEYEIPKEISGKKDEKIEIMSEFHVIAKGVDRHKFQLNPKDGIEKLQKWLKKVAPQWNFYVLKFAMVQNSTGNIIIWKRELVAEKTKDLRLEDRKGLTIKFINGRERDKPHGPTEKELWCVGGDQPGSTGGMNGKGGLAEEFCVMEIKKEFQYCPTCVLPT